MMTTIRYINLSLQIWGCILTAIIIVCLYFSKGTNLKTRRIYTLLLLANAGVMLFDALAFYFRGGSRLIDWYGVRLSNLIAFCCGATVPTLFLHYMMLCFRKPEKVTKVPLRISQIVCWSYWGLYLLNLHFPFFYGIDEQNLYARMALYPLTFIPGFLNIGLCFYLLLRYKSQMDKGERIISVIYLLVPIPAFTVQIFVYGLNLVNFAGMITMTVLFLFIQSEQAKKMAQQENELLSAQLNITLSRVRPHFLYNVLNAIYHLCEFDSTQAQRAVKSFSTYLRENLNAVEQQELIGFTEELNHLEHYLSLEKMRFGDKLKIVYDLQALDFSLPVLTVQPLAENAVEHGICRKDGAGTLTIATRENADAFQVIVSDDGIGFDPDSRQEDGKSHVGIRSVRDRLDAMCGGKLEIKSEPGMGTVATITIPKEAKK